MTGHTVVILPGNRQDDAARLEAQLNQSAMDRGGHQITVSGDIGVIAAAHDLALPPIAVVVFSPSTKEETDLLSVAISECQRLLVPILPVHIPALDFNGQTHPGLRRINGYPLPAGSEVAALADEVMRLVGLSEPDRRVFLSYARSDGSDLAGQLRHSLLDAGWSVFLDTVDIPYAADFQVNLDEHLYDKAFLLLVATQRSFESRWIAHEVGYAEMHGLGMMALLAPNAVPPPLYAIDSAFFIAMTQGQFDSGYGDVRLKSDAMNSIVLEVSRRHASAFRTRRETLLSEASTQLAEAGYKVDVVGEWALVATGRDRTEVVYATARAPEPFDLRRAELLRQRHRGLSGDTRGWIVHPLDDVKSDRAALIRWLSHRRKVRSTPVMLFRDRLTK